MENQAKKFSLHVDRKELGRKFMRARKKKSFWVTVAVIVVLVTAMTAGLIIRAKGKSSQAAGMTVQSAAAEKGSISTTVVGTGALENGTTTDIVVPTGIKVEEVLVKSGDTVEEGQTLATLNEASVASVLLETEENMESVQDQIDSLSSDANDSSTTEYLEAKVLYGKMEELKEAEASLKKLLETKAITASCAGTIDSVNVSADTEITQSTSSGSGSSGTSASGSSSGVSGTSDTAGASSGTSVMSAAGGGGTSTILLTASVGSTGVQTISDCSPAVEVPVTGKKPQSEIKETNEYTGTITWNCSTDVFQADTAYTATIKLTAKGGYEFSQNIIPEVKGADVTSEVRQSDTGESILQIKARFTKTAALQDTEGTKNNNTSGSAGASSGQAASGNASGTGNVSSQSANAGSAAATGADSGGAGTVGSTSSGDSSSGGSTGTSNSSEYSAYEASAFTIASGNDMAVSINVDELDILSVKEGQSASVTLDALDGQEFEGTITSVSATASSGSSSAKYPVKITLEKSEDMMIGMSASATIHIDESEDAVLIPVNALQEKGDSTFVYTGKDSDGNLTDEVEVEAGLSDGSQVEIVNGLEEGDTVYYLKAESTDTSETYNMAPGGQEGVMPDGGSAPGGGQMPDGEMPDMGSAPQGGKSE